MNRSWRCCVKQVSRVCIIMHDELLATLSLCSGAVTDVLGLSVINNTEEVKCVWGMGFVWNVIGLKGFDM